MQSVLPHHAKIIFLQVGKNNYLISLSQTCIRKSIVSPKPKKNQKDTRYFFANFTRYSQILKKVSVIQVLAIFCRYSLTLQGEANPHLAQLQWVHLEVVKLFLIYAICNHHVILLPFALLEFQKSVRSASSKISEPRRTCSLWSGPQYIRARIFAFSCVFVIAIF